MSSQPDPSSIRKLVVETLIDEGLLKGEVDPESRIALIGPGAICDSVGLVGFLVALEQSLNDAYQRDLILMDEKALSRDKSPFRSVTSLVDFVVELLQD